MSPFWQLEGYIEIKVNFAHDVFVTRRTWSYHRRWASLSLSVIVSFLLFRFRCRLWRQRKAVGSALRLCTCRRKWEFYGTYTLLLGLVQKIWTHFISSGRCVIAVPRTTSSRTRSKDFSNSEWRVWRFLSFAMGTDLEVNVDSSTLDL